MKKTARNAALTALLHVDENEGYSNIVLDKILREYQMEPRENALASHIFYGVLEKRITLDFYITGLLDHPNYVIHPTVIEILRMGIYQIVFLDKVPESAIVNEAVEAALEWKRDNSSGFINGLLREFLRKKDSIILPSLNTIHGLSVKYSIPGELIQLWISSYGRENTLRILESFLEKSKTYVRVNTTKLSVSEFSDMAAAAPYEALPGACEVFGSFGSIKGFDEGYFHVQDLSSQYLCGLVNPQRDETIIDVCAAPGGKTFTMSELMNGTGTVYSYDLYKGRVKLIRSGAFRLGLTNVKASMRNARDKACEISDADRILCDVPCSGFGTIRRKPEIRYKSLQSIAELPEIQFDILSKSAEHLKSGGLLVYSTCTLNPAENGEVADRFLREHRAFESVKIPVPKGLKRILTEPENQMTLLPFAGDTDGFFVAMFKRKL